MKSCYTNKKIKFSGLLNQIFFNFRNGFIVALLKKKENLGNSEGSSWKVIYEEGLPNI
jgi:hypothetical protein